MPSGGEAGRLRGLFDGVSDTVGWPSGSVVAGVVCLPRESSLEPLTGPLPSPVDKFPLVVGKPAQGLETRQFAASCLCHDWWVHPMDFQPLSAFGAGLPCYGMLPRWRSRRARRPTGDSSAPSNLQSVALFFSAGPALLWLCPPRPQGGGARPVRRGGHAGVDHLMVAIRSALWPRPLCRQRCGRRRTANAESCDSFSLGHRGRSRSGFRASR